jgi:PKD repeat protein
VWVLGEPLEQLGYSSHAFYIYLILFFRELKANKKINMKNTKIFRVFMIAILAIGVSLTGCQKEPVASFIVSGAGEAPCTVSFTNTSQESDSYSWSFGDGGSSTDMSPTHEYEEGGSYIVSLTATNKKSSVTVTQTVEISDKPVLTVTPTSQSAPKDAGSFTIAVTSNVDWTASCSVGWCTISPASGSENGSITVTYTENTETSSRQATITLSGTGVTPVTISLSQAGPVAPNNPFVGIWKDTAYPDNGYLQYTFNAAMTFQEFYYDGATGESQTYNGTFEYTSTILTFIESGDTYVSDYNFVDANTLVIDGYTYFKQ